MSFSVSDTHGPARETCPCGSGNEPNRQCEHPGCTLTGCVVCLPKCGASESCGRFCEDHRIDEIDGLKDVCLGCAGEICDEPDEPDYDRVPFEQSAAYRESMRDAGRGHLVGW